MAVEEAVLRSRRDDLCLNTLRIWRNDRCVIAGCHSNVRDEVNLEACKRMGIKIVRRTSGGGAVYHDLGNVNYSVILKPESMSSVFDVPGIYKMFSDVVVKGLKKLTVKAEFHPPNLILLNGKKISGLAQHRFYDTILFHGTLLLNSGIDAISMALQNPKHEVTNISTELSGTLSLEDVAEALAGAFQDLFDLEFDRGELDGFEVVSTKKLHDIKYGKDNWNLYVVRPFMEMASEIEAVAKVQ